MEQFTDNLGRVESISDGICLVSGLGQISINSVLSFPGDVRGLVIGFSLSTCEVIVFGDYTKIKKGDFVKQLNENLTIPVGESLIGRVIDPLGNPMDGRGTIDTNQRSQFQLPAKNVFERQPIDQALETGLLMVDSQVPIGRGQRELFIGENRIGKEEAALDAIINQGLNKSGVIGIYCTIGAQAIFVKRAIEKIQENNVMENSIFLVGRASDSAPLNYLAPLSAVTIAESIARTGKDVLIIFDNLTRHARIYRQISLLLKRAPGREAYPGDIFYLHSSLLERCGRFNEAGGGGSITAIPLVETATEDMTDYITTNLMSITDGHVLFTKTLHHQGRRPAISSEYSVSRVGGKAQVPVLRDLSNDLKSLIGKYSEMEGLTAFGAELQAEAAKMVDRGSRVFTFGNQDQMTNLQVEEQAIMIYFLLSDYIFKWPKEVMDALSVQFVTFIKKPEMNAKLEQVLTAQKVEEVKPIFEEVIQAFTADPNTLQPLILEQTEAEKETLGNLLEGMDRPKTEGGK